MAISTPVLKSSNGSTTDGTSFVTDSQTFTAGRFYLIALEYSNGISANTPPPSGISTATATVTWSSVIGNQYKTTTVNRTACAIWAGVCTASGTGATTINFAATATGCRWIMVEYTGVDLTTPVVIANRQTAASAGVTVGSTLTVTLSAYKNTSSRGFAIMGSNINNLNMDTDVDWTQLDEHFHATPSEVLAACWTTSELAFTVTNNTANINATGLIAIELLASVLGTVAATSAVTGAVSSTQQVSGTVAATSGATGAVTATDSVSGTVAATSATSGTVTAIDAASGTVAAVSGATGAAEIVTGSTTYQVAGQVDATSTATGTVTALDSVSGTVAAVSSTSGDVTSYGLAVGAVAATSAATGAAASVALVSGQVDAISGAAGAVYISGSLRDITVTVGAGDDTWTTSRPAGTRTVTRPTSGRTTSRPAATRTATRPADRWTATRGT